MLAKVEKILNTYFVDTNIQEEFKNYYLDYIDSKTDFDLLFGSKVYYCDISDIEYDRVFISEYEVGVFIKSINRFKGLLVNKQPLSIGLEVKTLF